MHAMMKPVVSSNVAGYFYIAADAQLVVTFLAGDVYAYEQVPAAVAASIDAATSVGRWLNTAIKSRYAYRKIESDAALADLLDGAAPLRDPIFKPTPRQLAQLGGLLERHPFLRAVF
jgi:hypothetical protein